MIETIKLGTYPIEEAILIRNSYKEDCGNELRIKFRGRGPRRGVYNRDLPLLFAERASIYIYIITEEDRARERRNRRLNREFIRREAQRIIDRQENRTKYKVGDTVKCIKHSDSGYDDDLDYGGAGWKKGKIFKIYRITNCNRGYIYWDKMDEEGVHESHLELAVKEVKIFGIAKFMESINAK